MSEVFALWDVCWYLCGLKKQQRFHNASHIHVWRPDEAPSECSLENQCLPIHLPLQRSWERSWH